MPAVDRMSDFSVPGPNADQPQAAPVADTRQVEPDKRGGHDLPMSTILIFSGVLFARGRKTKE